jgi:hypothetical protein
MSLRKLICLPALVRLFAVASHCTVHNTLDDPPRVSIELGRLRRRRVA